MALLMRWLHPDVAREGERSVFAARIAAAWNTLKTPERRAAYDRERHAAARLRPAGPWRALARGLAFWPVAPSFGVRGRRGAAPEPPAAAAPVLPAGPAAAVRSVTRHAGAVRASETRDALLARLFQLLRTIGLGALAVALAWLVVSRSLVAHFALVAPEQALWLQPGDPEALASLAERHAAAERAGNAGRQEGPERTDTQPPPGEPARSWSELAKAITEANAGHDGAKPDSKTAPPASETPSDAPDVRALREEARSRAETALAGDPINARALRILGLLAEAAGDEARALAYMQAAASRSIQESQALDWLMHHHHARKDYATALWYADALLRTRSQAQARVLPVLGSIAEKPEARPELEKLLAANPPWRRVVLSALPRAVTDARTPLVILLALRETPNPPTTADIRDYVSLLVTHKLYEIAYYTWLQFLPPERLGSAGLVFNGSFEHPPSGLPFDWVMQAGSGVTVDIVERPDKAGQRALYIELGPGRVELGGVVQTLLLGPGRYRLEGKWRGEIAGRRGLVWRVVCADKGGAPIGESPMLLGTAAAWKDVGLAFTVPAADCRAQHLRLELDARMASEQLVTGTVWLDDLAIAREP